MSRPISLNPGTIRPSASSSAAETALRDLFAAMPIVIFYKAARAALQRRTSFTQR